MDLSIAGILLLNGTTNAAVYAMLAMALVLVFTVTRVIFLPQGEYVAYGALTLALLQLGKVPGTVWLMLAMAIAAVAQDAARHLAQGRLGALARDALLTIGTAAAIAALTWWGASRQWPLWANGLLTLAIITPLGPLTYRLAYAGLADASVLVLLIVSVGVHLAMLGMALVFFGGEGFRNPSFWDERFSLGQLTLQGQSAIILGTSALLIVLLAFFFGRTLLGKALRATAVNRLGARLMGISTTTAGSLSFALAAFIGALSGLLIGSTTTVFYDSGFLIGIKGFIAAIFGALASYPAAALGALFVGLVESFGAFWQSAFKEVIVFVMILPVLFWRSFRSDPTDEEEE